MLLRNACSLRSIQTTDKTITMHKQIVLSLSLVALAFVCAARASAIKGLAPQAVNKDEAIKSVKAVVPEAAPVKSIGSAVQAPILESTKKIFNDGTIRSRHDAQAVAAPKSDAVAAAEHKPAVIESIAPLAQIVPKEQPIVVAAPVAVVAEQKVPIVDAKKIDELPVQSERSSVPAIVAPVHVPVVKPVEVAPVVQPQQHSQVADVAPVVAPVVVPAVAPVAPVVSAPVDQLVGKKDEKVAAPVPAPAPIPEPIPVAAPLIAEPVPVPEALVSAPVAEQHIPVAPVAPVVSIGPVAAPQPAASVVTPIVHERQVVEVAPVASPAHVDPAVAPVAAAVPLKPVVEEPLMGKKDEASDPLVIEVPEPDPQLVLSQPIDSTTKLLVDLDEHVQKFLPAEDKQAEQAAKEHAKEHTIAGVDYSPSQPTGKSSAGVASYASNAGVDDAIVPPLPASIEGVEKASGVANAAAPASVVSASNGQSSGPSASRQAGHNNQSQQQVITQLLDQLDALQNRIQDTMNQLVARRRYVMSALLRPMGTYVRRVRTNLERLQTRVNQLQAAASSVNNNGARPGGFVDAAAIESIRRRIDDISKRISDIVNRIRFSLTPTSAPLSANGRRK